MEEIELLDRLRSLQNLAEFAGAYGISEEIQKLILDRWGKQND